MKTVIKKFLGYLLLVIIPAVTILLWVSSFPLNYRFTNLSTTLISLGQVFGLLGITLFPLTIIFNTRLSFLEELFAGLNKVFPIHHFLGRTTFILLLFHPLFLAASRSLSSPQYGLLLFIPGREISVTFGILSLLILIILLYITFFVSLPYHIWRFTHQFLGIALLLAGIHILLISSDISFYPPLRLYVLTLVFLGLAAYCYRTVFKKYLVKKYPYFIKDIRMLNQEVILLTLIPKGISLTFHPGQFVFIEKPDGNPLSDTHPFSFISSPKDKDLQLGIKIEGDFTNQLKALKKGQVILIEGPYGKFWTNFDTSKPQIWIAGGIGITPFLSMAKALSKLAKVELFYSVKKRQEGVFLGDLEKIAKSSASLMLHPWFSDNQGHLTASQIEKLSGSILYKEIFLCGPVPMVEALQKDFKNMGVKLHSIHSEEFHLV